MEALGESLAALGRTAVFLTVCAFAVGPPPKKMPSAIKPSREKRAMLIR